MRTILSALLLFLLISCSAKRENAKEEWRYLYDLGMSSYYAKNYSEAIAHFYRASKVDPKEPRIWNALGITYVEVEEYEKAESAFKKALENDPGFTEAKLNLGVLYLKKKDYEKALSYLKEALSDETFDKKHLLFYHLAKLYREIGDRDSYLENLRKATAYNPLFVDAQLELGSAYMDEKRYEDAERLFVSLLSNNLKKPEVYLSLAKVYYETGKLDKAKEMIRFVLEDKQASNLHRTQAYEILSRVLVEEQRRTIEKREAVGKTREEKRSFGIQIAAFSNLKSAEKLVEELRKKGLSNLSVVESSGIYKVIYGRFRTREEAKQEIDRLRSLDIYGFMVEVE